MFLQINGLIQILAMLLFLHPLHVTVTEIELDEKDKRLEIMMRVFTDDLEQTLRKELHQPELDILSPKNATTDQLVENYLKDHFKIQLDGKPQKTSYIGHEKEDDAFILYIEVSNIRKLTTIQVTNSVMTDAFEDQSNIVNVTVREKVKSLRLTPDTSTDKLTFDSK
jgi:hypothetical protein